MTDIDNRPVLDGQELDTAIEHARAALAVLLRFPLGGAGAGYPDDGVAYPGHGIADPDDRKSYPKVIAEARALLGALLEYRLAQAVERIDEQDLGAVAAIRADRNEAIAVNAALLYGLQIHHPAWPDVAMTLGRLSYDRYRDPWPDPEPPDPDDLDAACDLLLRVARSDEADEGTALYLVLALRDRQRLLACPADTSALMTWGRRLLAFPDAGGLGRAGLQHLLELELRDRTESLARAGSRGPWGRRPLRLTARPA